MFGDFVESIINACADGLIKSWNGMMAFAAYFLSYDNFLKFFQTYSFGNGAIMGTLDVLYRVLKGPAVALAILFWMWGIFKHSATIVELKRPETLFIHIVRIVVVLVLIGKGPQIVLSIWNMGTSLASMFSTGDLGELPTGILGSYQPPPAPAVPTLGDIGNSLGTALVGFIVSLIITLVARVVVILCGLTVLVGVFTRFLKMALFVVLSPMALAAGAYQGSQRVAVQFIKNVVAVSCETSFTVLLLRLFPFMTEKAITEPAIASHVADAFNLEAFLGGTSVMVTQIILVVIFMIILSSFVKGLEGLMDSILGLKGV